MPTLAQLEREWKAASERSMAGAPQQSFGGVTPNTVTEGRLRYLVLKWTLEIDRAKETEP